MKLAIFLVRFPPNIEPILGMVMAIRSLYLLFLILPSLVFTQNEELKKHSPLSKRLIENYICGPTEDSCYMDLEDSEKTLYTGISAQIALYQRAKRYGQSVYILFDTNEIKECSEWALHELRMMDSEYCFEIENENFEVIVSHYTREIVIGAMTCDLLTGLCQVQTPLGHLVITEAIPNLAIHASKSSQKRVLVGFDKSEMIKCSAYTLYHTQLKAGECFELMSDKASFEIQDI